MQVKIVKKIKDEGYPTNNKKYNQCHIITNKEEKIKFRKVYVQPHKKERY